MAEERTFSRGLRFVVITNALVRHVKFGTEIPISIAARFVKRLFAGSQTMRQ